MSATIIYNEWIKCINGDENQRDYITIGKIYGLIIEKQNRYCIIDDTLGTVALFKDDFIKCNEDGSDIKKDYNP